jgi:hypothetical protein
MQGLAAFVRAAFGVASMGMCARAGTQVPGTGASYGPMFGRLEQAEDQVHPGEGSAERT